MSYCDYSVLCKNFPEKFYDLVKINGYIGNNHSITELEDHLYEFANFPSTLNYVIRDDSHNQIVCIYDMDNLRYYRIEIIFLKDNYVRFVVHTSYDKADCDVTMKFNTKGFESLFNFPVDEVFQTAEENTSEPEQPAEDAGEQSEMIDTNMGAMPIEDYREIRAIQYGFDSYEDFRKAGYYLNIDKPNISEPNPQAEENKQGVELTPLERNLFEQYYKASDKYDEYIALSDNGNNSEYSDYAIFELLKCDLLIDLINHNGLYGMYTAWLIERQKQEALTVL